LVEATKPGPPLAPPGSLHSSPPGASDDLSLCRKDRGSHRGTGHLVEATKPGPPPGAARFVAFRPPGASDDLSLCRKDPGIAQGDRSFGRGDQAGSPPWRRPVRCIPAPRGFR
jgi:hypothetical protein